MTNFNLQLAMQFKEEGITRVANNNEHFLKVARNIARLYAKRHGTVTSDDVRRNCPLDPLHPNAYGAVFRGKEWRFTGHFERSEAVSRKGGMQRVWRLYG